MIYKTVQVAGIDVEMFSHDGKAWFRSTRQHVKTKMPFVEAAPQIPITRRQCLSHKQTVVCRSGQVAVSVATQPMNPPSVMKRIHSFEKANEIRLLHRQRAELPSNLVEPADLSGGELALDILTKLAHEHHAKDEAGGLTSAKPVAKSIKES